MQPSPPPVSSDQATFVPQGAADGPNDEIDLRELVAVLAAGKWTIALIAGVILALGLAYAMTSTPIYQANALVQVESNTNSVVDELQSLTALSGKESPGQTEIQILKSRYVAGQVVDQLVLDITAMPRYFPVIGRSIAARPDGAPGELASPWFGLDRYAWGGEVLTVKRMKVPSAWAGAPLRLVALGGGRFKLHDPEGNAVLSGQAGELAAVGKEGDGTPRVEIFVQELQARPGTEFTVVRNSYLKTVEDLSNALAITEQGKGTGILQLSLEGQHPTEIAGILNAIARSYLRQNVERRSAQAEESLRFLDDQLPKLKTELNAAEEAFNGFRKRNESLDLSVESEGLLKRIVEVETQISELQLKRTQMGQSFAAQHPSMIAINSQLGELAGIKRNLESRVTELPDTQQGILRLQREVEVKNALYTGLLNKAQELSIVRAGTLGNVRIIDEAAVPEKPVKPRKSMIAALSLLLGLFAGVLVVFLQRSLRRGVTDIRQLETELGLTVYASVPFSGENRRLAYGAERR
jgi:tyrosine-protein kinase Etk/Wzc